jgi:hypothetical protein
MTPILGILASQISGHLTQPSDYESIATASGTGLSAVITFSSIPSTYKHLQIRYIGFTALASDVTMQLNSNIGLRQHALYGTGAAAASASGTGTASGQYISEIGFATVNPTVGVIDLLDYSNTNKYKTMRTLAGRDENGSGRIWLDSALYDTTAAISSITFTSANNYLTTTQFALYGIKG